MLNPSSLLGGIQYIGIPGRGTNVRSPSCFIRSHNIQNLWRVTALGTCRATHRDACWETGSFDDLIELVMFRTGNNHYITRVDYGQD
jgi:hypothetical protein